MNNSFEPAHISRAHLNEVALFYDDAQVTYKELWMSISQIARYIHNHNLSGQKIALLSSHDSAAYMCLLAMYYTNSPIVFIASTQPVERALRQMKLCECTQLFYSSETEDFASNLIQGVRGALENYDTSIQSHDLDSILQSKNHISISNESREEFLKAALSLRPPTAGLMYITFTSGSTGEPKAVPITVENFSALIDSVSEILDWRHGDRISQTFDFHFDPALIQIFWGLQKGATLYPLTNKDKFNSFQFIQRNQLTIWSSVPTLIQNQYLRESTCLLPSLRHTIFTGEALSLHLARRWLLSAPSTRLYNFYGPVEATVWATYHEVNRQHVLSQSSTATDSLLVSIGKPLPNVTVELSPDEGELTLSGPQVFSGYLNSGQNRTQKSYQTGDLAKIDSDGNIHLLNRKDHQVKIGGVRFSPFEIETLIETHFAIEKCLCVPIKQISDIFNSAQKLALVFLDSTTNQSTFETRKIIDYLATQLPGILVPKAIYSIANWPLTSTGKIDRNQVIHNVAHHEGVNVIGNVG